MKLRSSGAILSELYHLAAFSFSKRGIQLEKGTLIISIDVDVGCKLVGENNARARWRGRADQFECS